MRDVNPTVHGNSSAVVETIGNYLKRSVPGIQSGECTSKSARRTGDRCYLISRCHKLPNRENPDKALCSHVYLGDKSSMLTHGR